MLRPSRGVSASLKFRAGIRPYNRFKIFFPAYFDIPDFIPLSWRPKAYLHRRETARAWEFFCAGCPLLLRLLLRGFKNNPALECAAAGCAAGAAPKADTGLGERQWSAVMLLVEQRVQVGKSNKNLYWVADEERWVVD